MRVACWMPAIALVWIVALITFIGLAIRAATGGVLGVDVSIAREVQELPSPSDHLFRLENWLGATVPLLVTTVALAVALLRRRAKDDAVLVLLTLLPRSADVLVKKLVSEPRPSPSLVRVDFPHDDLSFPSGHAIGVTLVFALALILAPRLFNSRFAIASVRAVCVILIATIGCARIWIGAHWPTDVLGGYLYALLFLIPALAWQHFRNANPPSVIHERSDGSV